MRLFIVTGIVAIVVGLSLVRGVTLSAPDGPRHNEDVAAEAQRQAGCTRRDGKPVANQALTGSRIVASTGETRDPGSFVGSGSGRNDQVVDRARDNRRDFGDRSSRHKWGDQGKRPYIDVQRRSREC